MKFWCFIGLHHFAFGDNDSTLLTTSHENARSAQEHTSYHRASVKCLFCEKTVNVSYNMRQVAQSILYVKDMPKVDIPNEQVSKVQPQEIKMKPMNYEPPKIGEAY